MTDSEIIRALECCNEKSTDNCYKCPCWKDNTCKTDLDTFTLDLIKRQTAEIERYKGVIRLLENDVANAKTEAIKEFAERLKKYLLLNSSCRRISVVSGEDIEKLVKEMTEGQ